MKVKLINMRKSYINYFVVFRFYDPLEGYIEKTWVMNDFERT